MRGVPNQEYPLLICALAQEVFIAAHNCEAINTSYAHSHKRYLLLRNCARRGKVGLPALF